MTVDALLLFGLMILGMVALLAVRRGLSGGYRPTPADVRIILQRYLAGTITRAEYDQFESVPITHDPYLETVRERMVEILHDEALIDTAGRLTAAGADRVRVLLADVERHSSEGVTPPAP